MKHRLLGKNFEVSAVGLGCMGMSHAYGSAPDKKEMTELLAQAVDLGYTFFDTAECYGLPESPHHNEELLGKALKLLRNKINIGTKSGSPLITVRLRSICLLLPIPVPRPFANRLKARSGDYKPTISTSITNIDRTPMFLSKKSPVLCLN